MIAETIAKFIIGFIFSYSYIRVFDLPKKSILYFILLPGFIFTPDLKILSLSFIIALLLGFIYKRSIKLMPLLFLALIAAAYLIFRPSFNLFSDLGTINVINSQRGEDLLIVGNSLLAKFLHNKGAFVYTYLNNLEKYFTPVRIFAGALYPTISRYYPLGLLFPWDTVFLIIILIKTNFKGKFLFPLALLILPVGLTTQGSFSFTMALSLSFFIAILISEIIGNLSKTKYLLMILLMMIYTAANILTVGQFIGK